MKMRINWFYKKPEIREVDGAKNAFYHIHQMYLKGEKKDFWLEFYHKERGWINGNLHNLTLSK